MIKIKNKIVQALLSFPLGDRFWARVFFFLLFIPFCLQAQDTPTMDSLKLALKNAKHDTTRCKILDEMIESELDDKVWPKYNEQLKTICEANLKKYTSPNLLHTFYLKYFANSLENIGFNYSNQGSVEMALSYYNKSLKIRGKINDKKKLASSLINVGIVYSEQDSVEQTLNYFHKSLKISEEINDKKGIATTSNIIGVIYYKHGNIIEALNYYNKSLNICNKISYKEGISKSLNNIGLIYLKQGDVVQALDCYHRSLKNYEDINDKKGIAHSFNNIASIYSDQGNTSKALNYYNKSLKIHKEINDKQGIAGAFNNIGFVYNKQGNATEALNYYHKSLKTYQDIDYKRGLAFSFNNIASIYRNQGDLTQALNNYYKSLKIVERLSDKDGIATFSNNIAYTLLRQSSKIDEAKKLAEHSLKLSQELGYPEQIKNSSNTLSLIYKKLGNWKGAYEMQVLYKQMSDSVDCIENKKATIQSQYKYEYEKKVTADSIKKQEAQKVFNAQLKQEKTQRYALVGGVVLLIGFGGFMFNRFRKEKKQKKIIEKQKDIISHKNQEINQSIDYALHIQSHILPHYKITDLLPNSFLIYQAKDVVSGDFYWLEEKSNKVYMAVADCTGHGVPGAFMSMLGTSLLNEIFNKHEVESAADFLNTLNKLIKLTFKQHLVEDKKVNDGMDIAFVILDKTTLMLHYAGANRPLWIVTALNLSQEVESKNSQTEVSPTERLGRTFLPNKQAIGGSTPIDYEYTNHIIQLQKGDNFYLTTDGYADQFGGNKGKKMMTKVLKHKLEEMNNLTMQKQEKELLNFYNTWKGNNEQVDDITIMGIKV